MDEGNSFKAFIDRQVEEEAKLRREGCDQCGQELCICDQERGE